MGLLMEPTLTIIVHPICIELIKSGTCHVLIALILQPILLSCFISLFFQEEDPAHDETSPMATDVAKTSGYRAGRVAVTYTRWGHNRCPYGAQLVHSGAMAGTHYTLQGGGGNYLCLPNEPNYNILNTKSKGSVSYLYGTEYEHPIVGVHDHGAPCAVCYVSGSSVKEMIPATTTCPSGWTREYYGYIMSGHYSHKGRTEFLCIDKAQSHFQVRLGIKMEPCSTTHKPLAPVSIARPMIPTRL